MNRLSLVGLCAALLLFLSGCVTIEPSIDEIFETTECDMPGNGVEIVCAHDGQYPKIVNPEWVEDVDEDRLAKEIGLGLPEKGFLKETRISCNLRREPSSVGQKVGIIKGHKKVYVEKGHDTAGKNWYSIPGKDGAVYISETCFSQR